MPEIELDALLPLPPEKVLELISFELKRHANSIEGFAQILSKDEFSEIHDYAVQQIERQASITKAILDVGWRYLVQRGYVDDIGGEGI
jgi:hypothetical protein